MMPFPVSRCLHDFNKSDEKSTENVENSEQSERQDKMEAGRQYFSQKLR